MTTEHEDKSTHEDEFSQAFNAASGADEPETTEGQQDETGEQVADEVQPVEYATPQGGEQDKPANADDDPNSQTWEQRYRTLQGKYNHDIANVRSQQPAQPKQQDTDQPADPEEEGDADERNIDEDYPTLAKGIEKKAERIARQMFSKLEADMAPVREMSREAMVDKHFKAIRATHADFDDIVAGNDLNDWVNDQPSFARDQYQQVLERGNAQAVVELVSAFKKATKPMQQQVNRRDAQDAAVVRTRSTVAIRDNGEDKDDFEAGFNRK